MLTSLTKEPELLGLFFGHVLHLRPDKMPVQFLVLPLRFFKINTRLDPTTVIRLEQLMGIFTQLEPIVILGQLFLMPSDLPRREMMRTFLSHAQLRPILEDLHQTVSHREDAVLIRKGTGGE